MDTFKKFVKHDLVQWIGVSLIVEIIVEILNQRSIIKMIVFIATSPLAFLLGLLMVMVVVGIGFLFRKRLFTVALMSTLVLAMAIIGFVMLSMRVTPFSFGDFLAIEDGIRVVNKYMPGFGIPLIVVVIIAVIVGLVFLCIKCKKYQASQPLYKRVIAEVIVLFATLLLNQALHTAGAIPNKFTSLPNAYKKYGFTVCFAYSMFDNGLSKPSKYNEDTMDKVLANLMEKLQSQGYDVDKILPKLSPTVTPETTKPGTTPFPTAITPTPTATVVNGGTQERPNIIFVQLESFFDMTRMDGLEFSTDPLPNLHSMMKEYTSGNLAVPVIGAGTCNTGFEVITGFCIDWFGAGEYPYKTILQNTTCESMCYDAIPYGYSTHAVHNNTSGFYDRDIVFPKLGFQSFTTIETMENVVENEIEWAKDRILTSNILDAINDTDGPDLVYTISVQGHGAYPTADILQEKHLTVTGSGSTERDNQYTYYANQIYEMDQFIRDLTDSLNATGEKCVVVFFGDHLPNLGITEAEMGDESLYETPLLIWDNLGMDRKEINLEAFQLYSYVYKQLGMHEGIVNLCHQAYFESMQEAGGCILPEKIEAGSVYEEYTSQLHYLEYDLVGSKPLYVAWGGSNPYVEQEMTFGVNTLSITGVSYTDGVLYIQGEHFTDYTVAFINGEKVNTEYVSSNLVRVKDVMPAEGMEIFVAVYRNYDKKILTQSEELTMSLTYNIQLK